MVINYHVLNSYFICYSEQETLISPELVQRLLYLTTFPLTRMAILC